MLGAWIAAPRGLCLVIALLNVNRAAAVTLQLQFVEGQCRGDDIYDLPVANLSATLTLPAPTKPQVIRARPTDKDGLTRIDLPEGASVTGAITVDVGKGYSIKFPENGTALIPRTGPIKFVVASETRGGSEACSPSALAFIILDAVARTPLGTSSGGSYAASTAALLQGKGVAAIEKLEESGKDSFYLALVKLYFRDFRSVIETLSGSRPASSDSQREAEIRFVLGNAYFEEEEYRQATDEFYQADYYRPGDPVVLLDYAMSKSLAGYDPETEFKTALQSMTPETTENRPLRATLFLSYGAYLNTAGRFDEAEKELSGALELENSLPDRNVSKAMVHLELSYTLKNKFGAYMHVEEDELKVAAKLLEDSDDKQAAAIVAYRLADYKRRRGSAVFDEERKSYHDEAEKLFESTCKSFPSGSLHYAACLSGFAQLRREQRRCKEGVEMIKGLDADALDKKGVAGSEIAANIRYLRGICAPGAKK